MTQRINKVTLLDITLSVLETLVLTAPDREILSFSSDKNHRIDDIRMLIDQRLSGQNIKPSGRKKRKSLSLSSKRKASQIALLKNLITTRPELSPHLQAVFGSGKPPTNVQLEKLMKELARLGLLPNDQSDTK